ncbi:uncharacterized protein EAF01_001534 [Botrytis porri]|uniref:uncharacterized protein n=1 Tax=Botrytis porri TaxID=87229 RepID=UPI00190140CC|nr:uncharacterized protein EAF01_001534 [Botrytis porri]KAF7912513.1 hypothetical protein EAF01_001534 [Botrytis porri]
MRALASVLRKVCAKHWNLTQRRHLRDVLDDDDDDKSPPRKVGVSEARDDRVPRCDKLLHPIYNSVCERSQP